MSARKAAGPGALDHVIVSERRAPSPFFVAALRRGALAPFGRRANMADRPIGKEK